MIIQLRKKLLFTSAAAIVLSIASTAALASAMSYEGAGDDDDADMRSAACSLIGCANGNRVCGTAGGAIKAGIPPFVGEVSVTYTCYESAPAF